MGCVMQGNVFGVAQQVSNNPLLLGHPRDHSRTQIEAIAADGVAGVRAVGIVQVRVADEADRVGTAKDESKSACALQVVDNVGGSIPVLR